MEKQGENFKPTINKSLPEISNGNGVRVVKFSASKSLIVKEFPHSKIHKYTWTSPDWKVHKLIDHV
jgi:hypothetical protein